MTYLLHIYTCYFFAIKHLFLFLKKGNYDVQVLEKALE